MDTLIKETFQEGDGILKMVPNFIPVKFGRPGRRLRLHPQDYYKFGLEAGAIKERWLCSPIQSRSKQVDRPNQGYSYVVSRSGEMFLFKDAIAELKEALIGQDLWDEYKTFPVYSKFFDYDTPLYFHFHPKEEYANKVGCEAKPECYYFPPQMNASRGQRASTYFGLHSDVTKKNIHNAIEMFCEKDTHITKYSKAYDLEIGSGWYVPAGVLHAPGSLLTYEPQWGTDINCVLENVVSDETFSKNFLLDIVPEDCEQKTQYILNAMDWEENVTENFKEKYYRPAITLPKKQAALTEKWICYGNLYVSAKEVTIAPNSEVVLQDAAAYGAVILQGYGQLGNFQAEAIQMLRLFDQSNDEFFVSKKRAQEGVCIKNSSNVEPMVILQHFGPDNIVLLDEGNE